MNPEDKMELKPGSKAHRIAMRHLREQGCTCQPAKIEISTRAADGTFWDPEDQVFLDAFEKGIVLPLLVEHADDCALGQYTVIENPLDRRMDNEMAAALLLESIPALASGVTVLTNQGDEGVDLDRQLAGYVEIDEKSEYGMEIATRSQDLSERDNWSRWTLVDHGPKAKIVLEVVENEKDPSGERVITGSRGVICFEYPVDRDALLVAGTMGWLLVRVGEWEGGTHPMPEGGGEYAHHVGSGEGMLALSISTGDQVMKMIEIMDARNPNMQKRTLRDIAHRLDIAQETDPEWMQNWRSYGGSDPEQLKSALAEAKRPLAAAQSVFTTMALHNAIISDRARTTREVADSIDMEPARVEQHLHSILQSDLHWLWGREREDGEWEWQRDTRAGDLPLPMIFEGLDLATADGRLQAAHRLLGDMGIEIPIEEISPAMAFFKSMVDFGRFEGAFMELLRKPPPVWASAKGFAKTMEQVRQRAHSAKQLGIDRTDQLTYLHLHLGHSMYLAHVLVMDSAQVTALPNLSETEQLLFAQETPLAFDPLFIDFTGDQSLPAIESRLSDEGEVKLLGAMINSDPDPNVLFITPIFYYGNPHASLMAIALGTYAVNKSDVVNYEFAYVLGATERFTKPAMTLVANSDVLKKHPDVVLEYERIIRIAVERVIGALYLLEAANVEMVPRELGRRDRKRQEKRGWKIPLVVRVDRPSRRTYNHATNGNGQPRDFSHQFERIGHYNHYTRGSFVACIVCNGKIAKDLVCPRCNDTGLDPDKVKSCVRIDVKTGELTCPHGCRKIWISPHWVGPEDKPMIVKTRKIA